MTRLDLKILTKENIPDLEDLWDAVYPNRELPETYWEWLFDCPLPWVSSGIYEGEKLLAHYGAIVQNEMAHTYSSMSHPNYRHQGLYQKTAINLYTELMWHYNCEYAQFFSNKPIHRTHLKMGALDVYRLREYRAKINTLELHPGKDFYPKKYEVDSFEDWRYAKHPIKTYIYYQNYKTGDYVIMNRYENRLQIIDASNIENIIGLAGFIGILLKCEFVAFWSIEYDKYKFKYPSLLLDNWLMIYPIDSIDDNLDIKYLINKKKKDKLWMGMHDSY